MRRSLISLLAGALLLLLMATPAVAATRSCEELTPQTYASFSPGDFGSFAESMAADSHGNLWVSLTVWGEESNTGQVWEVTPRGDEHLAASMDISPYGMLMGVAFILMQVKSPMLVSVGMYLPIETTFAIFVGGVIKGVVDYYTEKRKYNEGQKVRVENTGVLLASGMIAGEALMGLLIAIFAVFNIFLYNYFSFFTKPTFYISLLVLAVIAWVLIQIPLKNAGTPDQPAPPASGM